MGSGQWATHHHAMHHHAMHRHAMHRHAMHHHALQCNALQCNGLTHLCLLDEGEFLVLSQSIDFFRVETDIEIRVHRDRGHRLVPSVHHGGTYRGLAPELQMLVLAEFGEKDAT